MKIRATTCEWMRRWSLILTIATFIYFWFVTYPSAKRGLEFRDLGDAGVALWIFLILGAIVILLQLVPAIIVLFSLVGTGTYQANRSLGDITDQKKADEFAVEWDAAAKKNGGGKR